MKKLLFLLLSSVSCFGATTFPSNGNGSSGPFSFLDTNFFLGESNIAMIASEPGVISEAPLTNNFLVPVSGSGIKGQRDPCICYFNGYYRIYYAATPTNYTANSVTLQQMVSADGTNWVNVAGTTLDVNPTGSLFDSGSVGSPFAYVEGASVYLYYQGSTNKSGWGAPATSCHVGVAISSDGTNFTRTSNQPLITQLGYAPSLSKQGSTYVLLFSQENGSLEYVVERATSTTGPTNGFTFDASFVLKVGGQNVDAEAQNEEPGVLKVSDGLFYIFVDKFASITTTDGTGYWWTTNLVGGTNGFIWGGYVNGNYATNDWNNSGPGSSTACWMTNGAVLLVYDAFERNGDTLQGRKIGGQVLRLGKVPRRDKENAIYFYDDGSGDRWVRILHQHSSRNVDTTLSITYLTVPGRVRQTFQVTAILDVDAVFTACIRPLGWPASAAAGSGIDGIDQMRVTLDTPQCFNVDVHLSQANGSGAGWYKVEGVGVPKIADGVPSEWIVADNPAGETVRNAINFNVTPNKGQLEVFNGGGMQRLAAGANNSILTADSTTATGTKWSTNATLATLNVTGTANVTSMTVTQVVNAISLFSGPTNNYDMSGGLQHYVTFTHCAITGFVGTGSSPAQQKNSQLVISNAASTNITFTSTLVTTPDGLRTYTVTNGTVRRFGIGTSTNTASGMISYTNMNPVNTYY